MWQTWTVMVVTFFALIFSSNWCHGSANVSLKIKLESFACVQIEAHGEGNRWLYLDDAGPPTERRRNTKNLISDGGCRFGPFYSNLCYGSANIS